MVAADYKWAVITEDKMQYDKQPLIDKKVLDRREWTSGLFACCDGQYANFGLCCSAVCCACYAESVIRSELYGIAFWGLLCNGSDKNLNPCAARCDIVANQNINEDYCTTCLLVSFCYPCALAQLQRDYKQREYTLGGGASAAVYGLTPIPRTDNSMNRPP